MTWGLFMSLHRIKHAITFTQIALLAAAGSALAATAKVYVADEVANTVSVIDAASFKKVASIPVGQGPHNVQVAPDGKWVWVTNNGEPGKAAGRMPKSEHAAMAGAGAAVGVVWALDTAIDTVVAKVPVGRHPAHVVVASDRRTAYITNGGDGTVSVVDANQGTPKKPGTTVSLTDVASMKVAATIKTGAGAHGVGIDRDGRNAFVTNTYANTVSVIDIAEHKVVATVPVGKGPNGISMAP